MATATKPDRPVRPVRPEWANQPSVAEEGAAAPKGVITPTQVIASAAAAASAFFIASFFGVSGTLIGTALFSVVATVSTALYQNSLTRTSSVLRRATRPGEPPVAQTPGSPGPVAVNALPSWLDPRLAPDPLPVPAVPTHPVAPSGTSNRLKGLTAVLIAMAAAFGITAGAIATVTSGIGQSAETPSGDRGGGRVTVTESRSSAGSSDTGSQSSTGTNSTDGSTTTGDTGSPSAAPSPTDTTPSTTPGTTVVPSAPATP